MAEIVATKDVKIGMVVSEPVVNSFGQTLISSGVEINEQQRSGVIDSVLKAVKTLLKRKVV